MILNLSIKGEGIVHLKVCVTSCPYIFTHIHTLYIYLQSIVHKSCLWYVLLSNYTGQIVFQKLQIISFWILDYVLVEYFVGCNLLYSWMLYKKAPWLFIFYFIRLLLKLKTWYLILENFGMVVIPSLLGCSRWLSLGLSCIKPTIFVTLLYNLH